MKVLIFYFSGTGNTQKVAELYRTALEREGAEVRVESLPLSDQDFAAIDFARFDLFGVGYPIHAFNAPELILKLAARFPQSEKAEKRKVFVFKTSGEPVRMSDVSSLKLRALLSKRGYEVTNEYQYCMPYNIIFRHSDEAAYKMWTTTQALVPIDVREIIAGSTHLPRGMFLGSFLAWGLRIEHWGAHFNGKHYKVNGDCVHCNLCVKACPVGNITVDDSGKLRFGKNCIMCMRCSLGCPKAAIEIGLFKKWKVNGAYSFAPPSPDSPPQDRKHADYCKKAYERYYAQAEEKIKRFNGN